MNEHFVVHLVNSYQLCYTVGQQAKFFSQHTPAMQSILSTWRLGVVIAALANEAAYEARD